MALGARQGSVEGKVPMIVTISSHLIPYPRGGVGGWGGGQAAAVAQFYLWITQKAENEATSAEPGSQHKFTQTYFASRGGYETQISFFFGTCRSE